MPVFKNETNGTWYVMVRYTDWKGERKQKCKRGFETKRDAQEWERTFQQQTAADLDMTFEAFTELYERDMKLYRENEKLTKINDGLKGENDNLRSENRDYKLLRKVFGSKQIDSLLEQAKQSKQREKRFRNNNFER